MEKFLKQRSGGVYKVFRQVLNLRSGRSLSSDYRFMLKKIGLDFDISLIEDLKRQLNREGETPYNEQLALDMLHSLVALFADHLLRQRLNKVKAASGNSGTPRYYNVSYDEMFSKYNKDGQRIITARQYKASVVYFYRNLGRNTISDPILTMTAQDSKASYAFKRHDIIRALTKRRDAVAQLSAAIREGHRHRAKSEQECAYISIYNRTLLLMLSLAEEDNNLCLGKWEDLRLR